MIRRSLPIVFIVCILSSVVLAQEADPTKYVDPFIGTAGDAHCIPGAQVPWGMVSVSPHNEWSQKRNRLAMGHGWKTTGATRSDEGVFGLGHVHISGSAVDGLGNGLLTASVGEVKTDDQAYRTKAANMQASPGYFAMDYPAYGIRLESTATTRVGLTKITFPASDGKANVIFDLGHASGQVDKANVKVVSPTEFEGSGWCTANATDRKLPYNVFFVVQFSRPAAEVLTWKDGKISADAEQTGSDVGAVYRFKTAGDDPVMVKVGVSYVSPANARLNMQAEMKDFDFDAVRAAAREAWRKRLSVVDVGEARREDRVTFYTALYHTMFHPNVFSDVNGEYPAMRAEKATQTPPVAKAEGYTRYTLFSLWDTYRTVHALLTLLYPQVQNDMVRSMGAIAEEGGFLPQWELASTESLWMVGDPATIVFADTVVKGLDGFDVEGIYAAALRGATQTKDNRLRRAIGTYLKHGYIPKDKPGGWAPGVVAHALEYYHADWALAQVARRLGKTGDAEKLEAQAGNWRKLYDPETGFLRPKNLDGSWWDEWDPDRNWLFGHGYTEGTAWVYRFAVPFDIPGLAGAMGGKEAFVVNLQAMFDKGKYDETNEPDIAYPFLFTFFPEEAWRSAKVLAELRKDYTTQPDGIPGNDDTGTMSAWYAWSCIGLYPAVMGSDEYRIVSPVFETTTLRLDEKLYGGRTFTIKANGLSEENLYIQSMTLNGQPLEAFVLTHSQIIEGGELVLEMGPVPPGR